MQCERVGRTVVVVRDEAGPACGAEVWRKVPGPPELLRRVAPIGRMDSQAVCGFSTDADRRTTVELRAGEARWTLPLPAVGDCQTALLSVLLAPGEPPRVRRRTWPEVRAFRRKCPAGSKLTCAPCVAGSARCPCSCLPEPCPGERILWVVGDDGAPMRQACGQPIIGFCRMFNDFGGQCLDPGEGRGAPAP